MDAIELLERQHREIEKLFRRAEKAESEQKADLVEELADLLAIHATLEEKIFYPGAVGARTEEVLRAAVEEHLAAKRVCADLLECDVDDPQYDAKISVLHELIRHHVEEERNELFPQVKKAFSAEMLEAFGDEMEQVMEQLRDEGAPRRHIPEEIDRPAQL